MSDLTVLAEALHVLSPETRKQLALIMLNLLQKEYGCLPNSHDSILPSEYHILASGQKIQAIKAVRARTGCSLHDANDLVKAYVV